MASTTLKISAQMCAFFLPPVILTCSECLTAVAQADSLYLVYGGDVKDLVSAAELHSICCCRYQTYVSSLKNIAVLSVLFSKISRLVPAMLSGSTSQCHLTELQNQDGLTFDLVIQ